MIPIITIDGPSGVGKGSVSLLLARKLQWHFLDSGALYRVLAFAAYQQGLGLDNPQKLHDLAVTMPVYFKVTPTEPEVWLGEQDITLLIRQPECGQKASQIAAYPEVRSGLLARQRAFALAPGLVADGRDMGTVVFPYAQVKFFLEATSTERAQRRYNQLKEKGIDVSLADLLADMEARDKRDSEREISKLEPAADAVIIDTTALSLSEVFERVFAVVEARLAK
jgi:cytidylate kinase